MIHVNVVDIIEKLFKEMAMLISHQDHGDWYDFLEEEPPINSWVERWNFWYTKTLSMEKFHWKNKQNIG